MYKNNTSPILILRYVANGPSKRAIIFNSMIGIHVYEINPKTIGILKRETGAQLFYVNLSRHEKYQD